MSCASDAQTQLYVSNSGTGTCTQPSPCSMAQALQLANSGDQILVPANSLITCICLPPLCVNKTSWAVVNKTVSIKSDTAGQRATIDCIHTVRHFQVLNGGLVLSGINLVNGDAMVAGGAIWAVNASVDA